MVDVPVHLLVLLDSLLAVEGARCFLLLCALLLSWLLLVLLLLLLTPRKACRFLDAHNACRVRCAEAEVHAVEQGDGLHHRLWAEEHLKCVSVIVAHCHSFGLYIPMSADPSNEPSLR